LKIDHAEIKGIYSAHCICLQTGRQFGMANFRSWPAAAGCSQFRCRPVAVPPQRQLSGNKSRGDTGSGNDPSTGLHPLL